MPASRAAARILAGSRPPRAYPASIKSDSPFGVTISVASPPSTSMKKISSVLADAGRTSARQSTIPTHTGFVTAHTLARSVSWGRHSRSIVNRRFRKATATPILSDEQHRRSTAVSRLNPESGQPHSAIPGSRAQERAPFVEQARDKNPDRCETHGVDQGGPGCSSIADERHHMSPEQPVFHRYVP